MTSRVQKLVSIMRHTTPYAMRGRRFSNNEAYGGRGGRDSQSGPWFSPAVQRHSRGRNGRAKRRSRPSPEPPIISHAAFDWYQHLFRICIDREFEEEQKQVQERLQHWSLDRLIREGFTLIRCKAKKHGSLFDRPIVRFSQQDRTLPAHLFTQGDLVTISTSSPLERTDAEGVVYEKRSGFISVVFEQLPQRLTDTEWRLDKGSNKIVYERMRGALQQMTSMTVSLPAWLRPLVIPSALVHITPDILDRVPPILHVLNATLEKDPSGVQAYRREEALLHMNSVPAEDVNAALQSVETEIDVNASQLETIRRALEKRMSLIQGPPGTGKTSTAVRLIKTWRRLFPQGGPVLATAPSNVAVDQLLSGCLGQRLNAVRLGQPVRVTEELQGQTLDALVQQHPLNERLNSLKDQIQSIRQSRSGASGREIGLSFRDQSLKTKELQSLMDEISQDVVTTADVICATTIGAGSDLLKNAKFSLVILDEATQCSEPEALVALMRADVKASVVLIGDHQQLPPTIISPHPDSQRILGTSLFQRLAALKELSVKENDESSTEMSSALETMEMRREEVLKWLDVIRPFLNNVQTTMLREQFRMHPVISEWPSKQFYGGQLIDAKSVQEHTPPVGLLWPVISNRNGIESKAPLLFVESQSGTERVSANGQSKFNPEQVNIVVSLVHRLLNAPERIACSSIGIITPYAAQVKSIQTALTDAGYKTTLDSATSTDDASTEYLEVKTVDGYQGREKDIIIFSTVRSNPGGYVGFLDDHRRLNVAMTRAKRGLIVIGDPTTLGNDPLWRAWLRYIYDNRFQRTQKAVPQT